MELNKAYTITPNSENFHFVKFSHPNQKYIKQNDIICYDINAGTYNCYINKQSKCENTKQQFNTLLK